MTEKAWNIKHRHSRNQMCPQSPAWHKYQASVRQFDAVLEDAKAVSSALVGQATPSANAGYGEQIFVTMLAHAITIRRLTPNPNRHQPDELWDLPSMCAIARCAIEAHDAFLYIAANSVPEAERDSRISLWRFHDNTRRLKILESIGSKKPEVQSIREQCLYLKTEVTNHPLFRTTRRDVQRKILEGDPPAFHLSQRDRCDDSGINFDYYNTVTMQLSQYVHTLPFALHQLFSFRAGSEDTLPLMSLPLEHVLPFLGRITYEMRILFPIRTPDAPARTAKTMAIWKTIYQRGVKIIV